MPPKQQRIVVERAAAGRRSAPRGVLGGAYDALTSAENASVVRSIAVFGVSFPVSVVKLLLERGGGGSRVNGD
jgi:hypothetical protein